MAVTAGYRPQAEDTSIETDVFEFSLLRQRSNSDRFHLMQACNRSARLLSLSGLKHRFPCLSGQAFAQRVARLWLQENYPEGFIPGGNEGMWIQDSLGLAAQLHLIFEQLQLPYYITGGVAASTFGDPRMTRDLDVVIAIARENVEQLAIALEEAGFYVPGIEDVKAGRSKTLGITHTETIARADLVIAGNEEWDQIKFERRRSVQIQGQGSLYFASPEDIVLNKLRWGQESQSEKQWRDVLGVLKVQGDTLDIDYLHRWADQVGLADALNQALTQAGL